MKIEYFRGLLYLLVLISCFLMFASNISADPYSATPPITKNLSENDSSAIECYLIQSPIYFDGILNEQAWGEAIPATNFKQREPTEGAQASEKTEVRILYDTDNLYVGIICYDREPERIIHNELQVDGNLENDDNFVMIIDTFKDKREAFYFAVNPNGARYDGMIDGNSLRRSRMRLSSSYGRNRNLGINEDWNGIWDVRAILNESGWTAEIVIPFKTLRFPKSSLQEWGINFKRYIARKNEEMLWCSWSRNDGIMQLSKTGKLTKMKNISRGRKIEWKPFVLGGLEKEENVGDTTFKYGLDVKYPLASDLTLNLTTFTDFAQIEADTEQINLTRFELIYPEKRDFFLEGAEIFEFGSRYSSPFYSREIGLTEDRELIPIIGGVKLTGRVSRYHIGMINMQTDKKYGQLSTNYSIVRFKREILENSFIGLIATNLYDDKHTNQAYGVDFSLRTDTFLANRNLNIDGSFIDTITPNVRSSRSHKRLQISYPNDLLDIFLYYKVDGENYNPEMGFIRRPGAKTNMVRLIFTPRPKKFGIRKLQFSPLNMRYITGLDNRLLTRETEFIPFGFETESGEEFKFSVYDTYEFLDEDFNIFRDIVIPVGGEYTWLNYGATFESNLSRTVSVQVDSKWGDFYNGQRKGFDSEFNVKINKHFSVTSSIVYNIFIINSSHFDTKEYGLRANINYSTRLISKTYIQWNNDTREININFRIHFIPKIGSDIYFVYNQLFDGYKDYRTSYNTGLTKIAYLLTF